MRDFEDYCWRDLVDDEVRHVYSPYVRERGVGRDPALVVIHPGEDFNAENADWLEKADRLVAEFRKRRRPVLHSVDGKPGLPVLESEKRCVRPCESAFFSTDLERMLKAAGARSLVLCGAPASGALRASAVEGKSFGYRVAIAEEATGDETAFLRKVALFDVAHKYADVMSLDELVALL